jgi:hypothetical protein
VHSLQSSRLVLMAFLAACSARDPGLLRPDGAKDEGKPANDAGEHTNDAADAEFDAATPLPDGEAEDAANPDGAMADPERSEADAPMSAADAAPAVNGCRDGDYLDATDPLARRVVAWDFAVEMAADRCMQIAVGQTTVFEGDFIEHPIGPHDGDANSPIPPTTGGDSLSIVFGEIGVFGFICEAHPEMRGAIRVVRPIAASARHFRWVGRMW